MLYDQAKTDAFTEELKQVMEKHDVQFNPAEYDDPPEFRSRDGGSIWVPVDEDFQAKVNQ